jgi:hypothetical protein
MPSSLTWIAHDRDEHDRVNRILAALKQSEARDELGLGAVRDSLADHLFPGTSTIQTRLRYFLIVPWCHQHIEAKEVPHPRFAGQVEDLERELIAPLLSHDDVAGVFGRVTGRAVKRLPSSVYWAGLGHWNIRRLGLSQSNYYRRIGDFYARRKTLRRKDDGEMVRDPFATMWHPDLPKPPPGFPSQIDLNLTRAEAEFLLDQLQGTHPKSMLSWLARGSALAPLEAVAFPWEYPGVAGQPQIQKVLHHAQLVSEIMWGAAVLYNWLLARISAPAEASERLEAIESGRAADLQLWRSSILEAGGGLQRLAQWDLGELWALCNQPGHHVTSATKRFIREWRERVLMTQGHVEDDAIACALVRKRELQMKRGVGRSRFANASLRAVWNGEAGTGRMVFRWPTVHRQLQDLHDGLAGA